jgi:hypothetical protein
MSLKIENSRRVAKSRPVCIGPLRPQLNDTGFVSERHQFKVFSSLVCYYNFSYMKFSFNYVILS